MLAYAVRSARFWFAKAVQHEPRPPQIVYRTRCPLEEERRAIAADLKEVYAEAKSEGYDVPALKALVKEACEDDKKRANREEREEILDAYRAALGQLADTPLGLSAYPEAVRERSKARFSEAMADHKIVSARLASLGMISEEAHAENVALSNALAEKFCREATQVSGAGSPAASPEDGAANQADHDTANPATGRHPAIVANDRKSPRTDRGSGR